MSSCLYLWLLMTRIVYSLFTYLTYWRRSSLGFIWSEWYWNWNSSTLATLCEEMTHWKRPWCWEGLGAGEGDDRGWDGWMASLTWWTWVWVNSGSWWWTGRPGVLQFMGSQSRTRLNDWTELNLTYLLQDSNQASPFLKPLLGLGLSSPSSALLTCHMSLDLYCYSFFSLSVMWLYFL